MASCKFCGRQFGSEQGVKAHLRSCQEYLKLKPLLQKQSPSRNSSISSLFHKSAASRSVQPLSQPLGQSASRESEQAAQLKHKRDSLLTALCSRLVDWYRTAEGAITPEMAVAAKVAILDELGGLPIEELSQTELDLRAEDIRNSIFAPYLQKQQDQMERQKDRHQKETLRRQEASEAHSRRAQRKAALIELGVARALRLSRASTSRDVPWCCLSGKFAPGSKHYWWATRWNHTWKKQLRLQSCRQSSSGQPERKRFNGSKRHAWWINVSRLPCQ